jgi:hypothetical protein
MTASHCGSRWRNCHDQKNGTSSGSGSASHPWRLKTPPLTSYFTLHQDHVDSRDVLICTVGSTVLRYVVRCIADLHAMLAVRSDWVELGSTDEQKDAKPGIVEA